MLRVAGLLVRRRAVLAYDQGRSSGLLNLWPVLWFWHKTKVMGSIQAEAQRPGVKCIEMVAIVGVL